MKDLQRYITTKLEKEHDVDSVEDRDEDIIDFVVSTKKQWETARQNVERTWKEAWAMYLGTPEAMEDLRTEALITVGNVNNDWRHRINVGKAFEGIETIHSYLMQATFPNRNWFSAEPTNFGYIDYAKIVENYTLNKLENANFQSHYANFLRQLLITGTSVMALPWRYETLKFKKRVKVMQPTAENWTLVDSAIAFREVEEDRVISNEPDFSVLDVFDVYLDPNATNPNESGLIRRIVRTRADILELARRKVYNVDEYDVMCLKPSRRADNFRAQEIKMYLGITLPEPVHYEDEIELWEYWGDIYTDDSVYRDVVALISGEHVLRFETNPYWSGKPFVIGTYIPLAKTPYAIGAIQPSLGLLHELNIITNQRLDNLELSVDSMWKYVDDGVINPEDVYTRPGGIIPVGDINNLQPIQMPQNFMVTYQEAQVLENKINANFGTPPLLSSGEVRGGERVTAMEIQAIKDAGGNRLSGVHKHIESTTLRLTLSKLFRLMQQFVNESEVVKVTGKEAGTFEYYQVDPDTFLYDFVLKPVGADYVVDRQKFVQDRVQLLEITSKFPQMAERINYDMILQDILQQMGFDDPSRYLIEKQEASTEQQQLDPNAQVKDELREMGGEHLLTAAQASENGTGDPMQFMNQLLGQQGDVTIPDESIQDDPLLEEPV
jgi:Bacteriophage head to tail connecting protein